jgi:hypothetical protein
MMREQLLAWAQGSRPIWCAVCAQSDGLPFEQSLDSLVQDLVRSGAATRHGNEMA